MTNTRCHVQVVLFLEQRKMLIRRSPSQISICSQSSSSPTFLAFISLLHLSCCGTHMFAADWLFPDHIDLFSYMLLKYCVGFFFLLAFPLAVLICHPEACIFSICILSFHLYLSLSSSSEVLHFLTIISQVWRETVRIFQASEGKREQTKEEKEAEIGKQMLDFSR